MEKNFYEFKFKEKNDKMFSTDGLKNKVVLIVNVASQCGYTPQYAGLESLYKKYAEKGLVILGFPCNQFGSQEPGSDEEISQFCSLNYKVTFPILSKINVNGEDAAPLYQWLKSQAKGILNTEAIKWNFTKFLIDRTGKVVDRYAPQTTPDELEKEIVKLL